MGNLRCGAGRGMGAGGCGAVGVFVVVVAAAAAEVDGRTDDGIKGDPENIVVHLNANIL